MALSYLIPSVALPIDAPPEEAIAAAARKLQQLGAAQGSIQYHIYRRSVDARKRDDIRFVYSVAASGDFSVKAVARLARAGLSPFADGRPHISRGTEGLHARPVVVGTGPAGLFAALLLAEQGYRPLVLERGGNVAERISAIESFRRTRVLDGETNIQFGAGGAGTFSDGKLVTRVSDPLNQYVLSQFVSFGAPSEITMLAKPHIGTDILRTVVTRMLSRIEELGGEVRYHTCMKELVVKAGRVTAVVTAEGETIPCDALILAVGHSARDTYHMLLSHGVAIEAKPFSVGLRIEHLQEEIDRAMYGRFAGHPALGHAEYTLSDRTGERGVYSCCRCPGGEVVAATSEPCGVVVNGMSAHARDGKNANAAIAVSVERGDYGNDPRAAIAFQQEIERAAYRAGGGDYSAPACMLSDFLQERPAREISGRVAPSYMMGGVRPALPEAYLPAFVTRALRHSLPLFERRIAGYTAPDAVLTGPETRTSAPLRILRNEARVSPTLDNLYPCGEGAGYAGGITSAALDGIHTAEAFMARYRSAD